jgi:hypothetical protein
VVMVGGGMCVCDFGPPQSFWSFAFLNNFSSDPQATGQGPHLRCFFLSVTCAHLSWTNALLCHL